jgi:DNA-binding NtrC family response regulator
MLQVMVIDDERIVGKRLQPALEKAGYQVETFLDGPSALRRFEEGSFDIVVTDIRMGEIDGIDVLREVVAKSVSTKVIVITGYASVEVAREALARGAFEILAKPFKPGDLLKIVNRAAKALEK